MFIQNQFGIIQNLQTSPIPQTSFLVATAPANYVLSSYILPVRLIVIHCTAFETENLFSLVFFYIFLGDRQDLSYDDYHGK